MGRVARLRFSEVRVVFSFSMAARSFAPAGPIELPAHGRPGGGAGGGVAGRIRRGEVDKAREQARLEREGAEKAMEAAIEAQVKASLAAGLAERLAAMQRRPTGRKVSGLKWIKLGQSPPGVGQEILNEKLAFALKRRTDFTPAEVDAFGLGSLHPDNFIKAGEWYFKPDASSQDSKATRSKRMLVSGAGSAEWNGEYVATGSSDSKWGAPMFRKSSGDTSKTLYLDGDGCWCLGSEFQYNSKGYDTGNSPNPPLAPPSSGWRPDGYASPGPTLLLVDLARGTRVQAKWHNKMSMGRGEMEPQPRHTHALPREQAVRSHVLTDACASLMASLHDQRRCRRQYCSRV